MDEALSVVQDHGIGRGNGELVVEIHQLAVVDFPRPLRGALHRLRSRAGVKNRLFCVFLMNIDLSNQRFLVFFQNFL